jgi:hypothetical protein
MGAKLLGCDDNQSTSNAKVNNGGDILPIPPNVFVE